MTRGIADAPRLEKPSHLPTWWARLRNVIDHELRGRAEKLGPAVMALSAEAIRERLSGNPWTIKIAVPGLDPALVDIFPKGDTMSSMAKNGGRRARRVVLDSQGTCVLH